MKIIDWTSYLFAGLAAFWACVAIFWALRARHWRKAGESAQARLRQDEGL